VLTFERFDARDGDAVAQLAAAERAGALLTLANDTGGRLVRRPAHDDATLAPGADYAHLPDGRVLERFGTPATPFYLFGAGHVGRALVLALAPLPFAVIWVDPRPSAFPTHIPSNTICRADAEPARLLGEMPDGAFIAIMTHSHALDLDIAAATLRAERFPYVGLIGSDTKRARFVSTMHKLGMTDAMIDRLICPIGLTEIRDKAPAAIAAAIVAQLLIQRDALAQSASESEQVPTAPDLTGLRHA
jgi:xanthine dehydrogenase accessory factor